MCAGTTATSWTARIYRWSFAPNITPTCPGDVHRSRMMTPSRRSSLMTTDHAHLESLISSTREHFCQGDRQLELNHCARVTGTLPYPLRVGAWTLGPWEAQRTACRWSTDLQPTSSTLRGTGPSNPGHRILLCRRARELAGAWVTGYGSQTPEPLARDTGPRTRGLVTLPSKPLDDLQLRLLTCFESDRQLCFLSF
eukprot:1074458-Amphidinium_carterae.1